LQKSSSHRATADIGQMQHRLTQMVSGYFRIFARGLLDLPTIAELIDAESQTSSRSSPSAKLSAILLKKFKQILAGSTRLEVPEIGYLIDQVDRMTGEEFEEFLACCFRNLGYAVEMTPKTGDFGADLILSKARKKTVIQAKRYQGKVGNSAVQEVVSAVKYYGAQDAIAITNSEFTANAQKLAQANRVQLWGREQLIDLVIRAKK
jgi:HJR/Mrr/RecB family endonuclease